MTGHDDDIALLSVDFLKNVRRNVAGSRNEDTLRRDACFTCSPVRTFEERLVVETG
jgi:hypothetical protein